MEQKIAELTEKIYKEGIEKGEEQKKSIIEAAKTEALKIKEEAQKEYEKIIADAQEKANEIKKNSESEIKLSSQQAISSLKQKIINILLIKSIDENINETLSDPNVIKELITIIIKNWNFDKNEANSLDVLLPESNRDQLEQLLKNSVKKILKEGISLSFSKSIKGGFQIGPKDGTFKVSLTDEDFSEFFKEYLRPKTRSFLFEE